MWVHLGLLDLLDRRWVLPHMKHPVLTEQVGSATPEISFNDPYTLQHASLAQHHNTNFLPTPFSVQFYPLRNKSQPIRTSQSFGLQFVFERPHCVLKSEDCSENYYVPLWQVNCKQTQTEKLHVSVWRWVVAPVSSVQYREKYIWL